MWSKNLSSQATPLGSHTSWNTALHKPKRCKIEIACDTCRLRKSRCDGGRPKCGACMRRKKVSPICVYSEHPSENRVTPLPPDTRFPSDQSTPAASLPRPFSPRARQISVQEPSDGRSPNTDQQHEQTLLSDSTASPNRAGLISEVHRHSLSESRDGTRDETNADDAAGNEAHWMLKVGLLAASSSTNFFNAIFGASDNERMAKNNQNNSNDPNDANKSSPDRAPSRRPAHPLVRRQSIYTAEYVLPPRKVADGLLDLFFKHAYIHWIDRLRFMRWYEGLWTGDNEPEDLVDEQIQYAHLNLIFGLVYQTEPEQIAEDQDQLAHAYFLRAQKLLHLNVLELSRLDLLYALLLLTQWLQSVNQVRRCRSLVGLCVLIAHHLGLHVPGRIDSLRSQHQREMARRAWHGCILMDRITAMISGQPLQISQAVARQTPLFEAIDDEYMGTGEIDGVQPAGQPANPSFFRAFCQLHLILGDVLAPFHSGHPDGRSVVDVSHIIEIDGHLDRFSDTLPPHLRLEKENPNNSTYTGQIVHLHARFLHVRIMLYRVFFLHAAENSKRSGSTASTASTRFADTVTYQGLLTCVRTAQEILELISSRLVAGSRGPHLVPPWWHTVTYVYTAATIVIAAHMFPAVVEEFTASSLEASIQQAYQILDHPSRYTESARRCKKALAVLCERHVHPAKGPSTHTPRRTSVPAGPGSQMPSQIDVAEVSAGFGWDFTNVLDPSDPFRGEGMESFLMDDWL